MMSMGKTLLQAGLKLTNLKKYIYPTISNAKFYCISLPFETRYYQKELKAMKFNFDEEDHDEDQYINIAQFNNFIQRTMGRSLDTRELYCLFNELDKDRDGLLTFCDIVTHLEKQFEPQQDGRLRAVFCLYDKDEDGKIKLHELREILFHLGFYIAYTKAVEDFFNRRDPKCIRKIDFEDFKKLVTEDIRPLVNR